MSVLMVDVATTRCENSNPSALKPKPEGFGV